MRDPLAMGSSFRVNPAELDATAGVALRVVNQLDDGNLSARLGAGSLGSGDVEGAVDDFVGSWSNRREKVREQVQRLATLLQATADAYNTTEVNIQGAMSASGGAPAGGGAR